jgi:hypothetical protein
VDAEQQQLVMVSGACNPCPRGAGGGAFAWQRAHAVGAAGAVGRAVAWPLAAAGTLAGTGAAAPAPAPPAVPLPLGQRYEASFMFGQRHCVLHG